MCLCASVCACVYVCVNAPRVSGISPVNLLMLSRLNYIPERAWLRRRLRRRDDATGGGRQDDVKEQERTRPGPYVANGRKKIQN